MDVKVTPKLFRLEDPKSDADVLGGTVTEDNPYVRAYPSPLPESKHPLKLEVGETSMCKYSLSGSSGIYRVVRVA